MRKLVRNAATFLLALISAFALCITAYAEEEEKDYRIYDPMWEWDSEDTAIGLWEKPESGTNYMVRLYKGSSLVFDWKKATTSKYDFTSQVIKKGTGIYTFEVYPQRGGVEMAVRSDELEVTSTMLSAMKKKQKADAQAEATADGWHSYPQNLWTYGKGNNTLAKNEWMDISGATYHFDSNGYMATGWQLISGVYYYFDPKSGALYRSCTTPDGYLVNADGAWVDEAGNIAHTQASQGKKTTSNLAKNVSISIKESGVDGVVKNAEVTGCSHGTILGWEFATPYERWSPGSVVRLTVTFSPKNGYVINNQSKLSCSNGSVVSWSGTDPVTVLINYTPKMRLEAPKNVYVDSMGVIRWLKVPHAKAYRVTLSYEGTSSKKSYTVTDNWFELIEYANLDYEAANVKVSALFSATKSSSTYLESEAVSVGSVSYFEEHEPVISGEFGGTSENMFYKDESGQKVTGWQEIGGKWYYFGKDKFAVGPGWFQDTDSNWYWFDANHVMQVGTINDGTADYFMNDGSNGNFPYGAWVH